MRLDPDDPEVGKKLPELETFDAVVPISGMLPNDVKDWPPHMQDELAIKIEEINRGRSPLTRLALAAVDVRKDEEGWYAKLTLQTAVYVEKMS